MCPLDIMTMQKKGQQRVPLLLSEEPLPDETWNQKATREKDFPLNVLKKAMSVRLEDGAATVEVDRERILSFIQESASNSHGSDYANRHLHGMFARVAWPLALRHGQVEDFDENHP